MRKINAPALDTLWPTAIAEHVHLLVREHLAHLGAPFNLRPSAQRGGVDTISPTIEAMVRFAKTGLGEPPNQSFYDSVGRLLGPTFQWPIDLLTAYQAATARQQLATGVPVLSNNLAALGSCPRRTLRRLVADGRLSGRMVDGHWYVECDDAVAWLRDRKVPGYDKT